MFFADQQIDRSPTGGAVAVRAVLAYAKGDLNIRQRRTYHSLLSLRTGTGGFTASITEAILADLVAAPHVKVCVEGHASYTVMVTAIMEKADLTFLNGFALLCTQIRALSDMTMDNWHEEFRNDWRVDASSLLKT